MRYQDFKERKSFAEKQVIPVLRAAGLDKKADNIAQCGLFKHVAVCQDCGTQYFNGASSCKDRLCPICQKKRSLLWYAKVLPIVRDFLAKGYSINIVNFTIKDMDNLESAVNLINKSFRYMAHDNKRLSELFNAKFIGGIRSMEVIRGKNSGKWHPHFHCLVIKKRFSKDYDFVKSAWEQSLCVVSGNRFTKLGSVYLKGFSSDNAKGIDTAVCEVFKYMIKFNFKVVDIKEFVSVMSGRRTIFSWGCFRTALQDFDADNYLDKTVMELEDCVCKVCGGQSFETYENVFADYLSLEDFFKPSDYYEQVFGGENYEL